MQDLAALIEKFGIGAAMLVLMVAFCWWMMRKFMCFLEKSNAERKEQNDRYNTVVENHIAHSTEAQENLAHSIIDFRTEIRNSLEAHTRDHKDIIEDNKRGHKEIIDTLKGI